MFWSRAGLGMSLCLLGQAKDHGRSRNSGKVSKRSPVDRVSTTDPVPQVFLRHHAVRMLCREWRETLNRHVCHKVKQTIWLIACFSAQTSQTESREGRRRHRRHNSAYSPSEDCTHLERGLVDRTVNLIVHLTQENTFGCVN